MKVQIPVIHVRADLGSTERGAEPIWLPWTVPAICQDRGRAFRDSRQHVLQSVVKRDNRLALMLAFARCDDDSVLADV